MWRLWPVPLLPLAVVAAIVLSGGHALFLAIPLVFFCVVRPLLWGRRGGWAGCGWGVRYSLRTARPCGTGRGPCRERHVPVTKRPQMSFSLPHRDSDVLA